MLKFKCKIFLFFCLASETSSCWLCKWWSLWNLRIRRRLLSKIFRKSSSFSRSNQSKQRFNFKKLTCYYEQNLFYIFSKKNQSPFQKDFNNFNFDRLEQVPLLYRPEYVPNTLKFGVFRLLVKKTKPKKLSKPIIFLNQRKMVY